MVSIHDDFSFGPGRAFAAGGPHGFPDVQGRKLPRPFRHDDGHYVSIYLLGIQQPWRSVDTAAQLRGALPSRSASDSAREVAGHRALPSVRMSAVEHVCLAAGVRERAV